MDLERGMQVTIVEAYGISRKVVGFILVASAVLSFHSACTTPIQATPETLFIPIPTPPPTPTPIMTQEVHGTIFPKVIYKEKIRIGENAPYDMKMMIVFDQVLKQEEIGEFNVYAKSYRTEESGPEDIRIKEIVFYITEYPHDASTIVIYEITFHNQGDENRCRTLDVEVAKKN